MTPARVVSLPPWLPSWHLSSTGSRRYAQVLGSGSSRSPSNGPEGDVTILTNAIARVANRGLGGSLRQFVRENRRLSAEQLLAILSEKYLRTWYNEDCFAFDENGEHFALEAFAKWNAGAPAPIWDVGAHIG